jgi:hypothetical protein
MKIKLGFNVIGCGGNTCIECDLNQDPTKCNEYRAGTGLPLKYGIPNL